MPKQLKLTDGKREEMFLAFCEQPTIANVTGKCRIHHLTAKKYRAIDNWDERYQKVRNRTLRKEDNEAVRRKERQLKLSAALQKIGSTKFFDDNGKLKKEVVTAMTAGDGIRAITEGIRIEQEVAGDGTQEMVIRIKMPKGLENME